MYLHEDHIEKHPFDQFDKWYHEVLKSGLKEPSAVFLATCSRDGKPSARTVLLKESCKDGFTFFTNYDSRKGRELEENPKAAMLFYWDPLDKQVRVEGLVEKVSDAVSDAYFKSRPRESRLGALVSAQSQVLENRQLLEDRWKELSKKYESTDEIPRPPHWGGYILKPTYYEFWQARQSRLHDRIAYVFLNKAWKIYRLAP